MSTDVADGAIEVAVVDLVELRAFLETVRLASFSDAARALGVTQPAVSRQVQRLEREVGASLLQRGDGPVAPTAAGHELLRFAERVLA
ncbi:MAG: LysR family transcriptional regulator, partial [Chloroflexi bacterium]|nr:LysR family transcriptional regulator [Chloroflexota bacterium]